MAMRLSGLSSGIDTENVVAELMKAQRTKTTKLENKITKLEWTQDKWKTLNTKIYSFYTGALSKMRFQGNYSTKQVTSSDNSKIEVKADSSVSTGNHSVQVKSVASSQYITGGIIEKDTKGKAITTGTKLSDLGFDPNEGTTIKIEAGTKKVSLEVGSSTTVGDFLNTCKNAGLSATYDTSQKRFFIGSKESGVANSFTMSTSSSEAVKERNEIRDLVGYGSMTTAQKTSVNQLLNSYANTTLTAGDRSVIEGKLLEFTYDETKDKIKQSYMADPDNITAATDSEKLRLEAELEDGQTLDPKVLEAAVKAKLTQEAEQESVSQFEAWKADPNAADNEYTNTATVMKNKLTNYITDNGTVTTNNNNLSSLKLSTLTAGTDADGNFVINNESPVSISQPKDAQIIFNGANITSSSNTIEANGLTFTVKGVTGDDKVNLNVTNNKQAVYDMVKNFVKGYNDILKELNDSYYASSAKGYEPLTDEEKEAMTDTQIEKWEEKIKTSLLRRDDNAYSVMSMMTSTMNQPVEVDGKKYSLSSFGIGTYSYQEKGLLHISGDTEDPLVSYEEDKLMKALSENPNAVTKVLSKLTEDLYGRMSKEMKSSSLNSALTFYNDKEIKNSLTDYQKRLKIMENKLNDTENKYYKQFSAMESAMSRMNSQSSSLAAMLGNA
ncbi:MAG: hypothetical protein K0S47_777 [Herbinix sp.]|jgi:flagellar hook-associated protein 2|nr:hypothetical protein [Herbinix sp.]